MKTIAIMVSTPTGGIGINDRLPWFQLGVHVENFEELSNGQVVLVGGGAFRHHNYLRGGVTYVYTNTETFQETDELKRVTGDPQSIIDNIRAENPDKNIIIAGGLTVYQNFYDLIDEWRVTIIEESVVFNQDINLTDIQHKWNNRRLVSTGQDLNQTFSTFHYTK
jgi:dihydrofolate reductase